MATLNELILLKNKEIQEKDHMIDSLQESISSGTSLLETVYSSMINLKVENVYRKIQEIYERREKLKTLDLKIKTLKRWLIVNNDKFECQ